MFDIKLNIMRYKSSLVLLVLNILLFGGIYFFQKSYDTKSLAQTSELTLFNIQDFNDVDKIEISGSLDDKTRTLEKTSNGHWMLIQPISWKANPYAIMHIFSGLRSLNNEVRFPVADIEKSGQDLSYYGLDRPLIEVTLFSGEQKSTLLVGHTTQVGARVYALSPDGHDIIVMQQEVVDALLMDLDDLRSEEIFTIQPFQIDSISLKNKQQNTTTILTHETGTWSFSTPLKALANDVAVNEVLAELYGLKVKAIIPQENAKPDLYGLDNPQMRITLSGDALRQTLSLGNEVPNDQGESQYYASFSDLGSTFVVTSEVLPKLMQPLEYLRDKRFIKLDTDKLTKLHIKMGDKSIALQKLETGLWQVIKKAPNGELIAHEADTPLVEQLIQNLVDLEAVHFVTDVTSDADRARFGFNDPQRIVTFDMGDYAQRLTLGNFDTKNQWIYAQVDSSSSIYEVEAPIVNMLQLNTLHYLTRLLENFPQGLQVAQVALRYVESQEMLLEASFNETGEIINDDSLTQGKRRSLDELRTWLIKPLVKDYLTNDFEKGYALGDNKWIPWAYSLDVVYRIVGQEQLVKRTYYFTERISGNFQVGGSQDYHKTFTLTQDLMDILFALTFKVSSVGNSFDSTIASEGVEASQSGE